MRRKSTLFLVILISLFLVLKGDDPKPKSQTPTFKEILDLSSPGNPQLSPDGQTILFSLSSPDWEKNEYISQIWMIRVKTGEIKQMTYAKQSSYRYRWAPDSKSFSFISTREKKPELYLMSATGGEGKPIFKFKTSCEGYQWSPKGDKIAYIAPEEKSKQQKGREKKYGEFSIIDGERNLNCLWLLNPKTGKSEKIVDQKGIHVTSIAWAPLGDQIAFDANPDSRILSFSHSDIYLIHLTDKKIRKLVGLKGPDSSPVWSPDGRKLAFNTGDGKDSYFLNNEISIIPAAGGNITCLTKDFDEDPWIAYWKKEGIYFYARQEMNSNLFLLDPRTRRISAKIPGKDLNLRGFSLDKKGSNVGYIYLNSRNYPEVYFSSLRKIKPRKLTNFSQQIAGWKLASKEPVYWTSKDKERISGVLIKPANFNPGKKYPLFVIIHGGPTGISYPQKYDRYNTYYPIEQWAARGAVILEPNYRGSAGFGEKFRSLNYRNLGVGDYWDVISGVDHLISLGFVDQERIAAMGWSQGGYISAFITTYSDRFKAVSVGAGISDWVTYYYRTDITPFTIHYLGANPWKDPEIYRKTSPMYYINQARTPTLIQHGEFDRRVPPTNAYKLYLGLPDQGVPSKLIIYKGFGHGISKPKEKLAVLTHNWNWFARYIFGEKIKEETFGDEKEAKNREK